MKKYEKPALVKAARLQALRGQQVISLPEDNSSGSGTGIN